MKAIVRFDNDDKFVRLFHAFHAVHDNFTHDKDDFILQDEETNKQFLLSASMGYLMIGEIDGEEETSYWTENVAHEDIYRLFVAFLRRRYDAIAAYDGWIGDNCTLE